MTDTDDFMNLMAKIDALGLPEPSDAPDEDMTDVATVIGLRSATAVASQSPVSLNREKHAMTESESEIVDDSALNALIASLKNPCPVCDPFGPVTDEDAVCLHDTAETDTTDATDATEVAVEPEEFDGSTTAPCAPESDPDSSVVEDDSAYYSPHLDESDEVEEADIPAPEHAELMSAAAIATTTATTTAMTTIESTGEGVAEPTTTADATVADESCPIADLMTSLEKWKPTSMASVAADGLDVTDSPVSTAIGNADETDTTDSADVVDTAPIIAAVDPGVEPEAVVPVTVSVDSVQEFTKDGRPVIQFLPGHLQADTRTAERCLASTGIHFQRGRAVVTVYTDPATGESVVQDLQPLELAHALDGVSAWARLDKRSNTWVPMDPPKSICNTLLKIGRFEHLPVLNGLARQPFLRPDGSVCLSPGYDAATGLFGVFEAGGFDVPAEPTRDQAQQALAVLDDLLTEFTFASPHDRSAAVSAMLTAAVRISLPLAPLFHVRAPQSASGKSYLCKLITTLATPQQGTPAGFPVRDEECTKLLVAQLMRSPAVIEFDNLIDDIKPFKSLCTALTDERMAGRVLGGSKMVTVSTRVLLLSSGNNVGPTADMNRLVRVNYPDRPASIILAGGGGGLFG